MPSRRDPLLARALLEADLQTDPQISALTSLRSELAGGYTRSRRVNHSNAAAIREATSQARPEMSSAFDQALASARAQRGALGVAPADPQAAAFTRRVSEQKSGALNDLTQRGLRAEEGKVFANQTARDQYFGDKSKINDQLVSLLGRRGQLAASALGTLEDKAQRDATTRRGQTLSHRRGVESNRIARDRAAQQAKDKAAAKSKAKLRAPGDHEKAKTQIDSAKQWITNLGQSMSSTQVRALLATGGDITNAKGEVLKVPQIPKTYINVAYDLRDRGGLSKPNITALHQLGYSIKTLGYSTKAGKNMATKRALSDLAKKRRAGGRLKPVG